MLPSPPAPSGTAAEHGVLGSGRRTSAVDPTCGGQPPRRQDGWLRVPIEGGARRSSKPIEDETRLKGG